MHSGRLNTFLKKHAATMVLVAVFLTGVGLLAYPTFSDWWNSTRQSRAIAVYNESVESIDKVDYDAMLADAYAYNEELAQSSLNYNPSDEQLATYNAKLDITGTGIMGYIDIPKIHCQLPIYHGTDEAVLQVAVGHLPGSSLPVGGETTHCVISSHRGLPSARLFTDLDQLVEGDTFVIRVLNETLTYEVDQIRIVLPNDLSALQLEQGQDLCTLVTCTPYSINTHRLLVRGHRIPNTLDVLVTADAVQIANYIVAPVMAIPLLVLLFIWVIVSTSKPRGARSRRESIANLRKRVGLAEVPEGTYLAPIDDEELLVSARVEKLLRKYGFWRDRTSAGEREVPAWEEDDLLPEMASELEAMPESEVPMPATSDDAPVEPKRGRHMRSGREATS